MFLYNLVSKCPHRKNIFAPLSITYHLQKIKIYYQNTMPVFKFDFYIFGQNALVNIVDLDQSYQGFHCLPIESAFSRHVLISCFFGVFTQLKFLKK